MVKTKQDFGCVGHVYEYHGTLIRSLLLLNQIAPKPTDVVKNPLIADRYWWCIEGDQLVYVFWCLRGGNINLPATVRVVFNAQAGDWVVGEISRTLRHDKNIESVEVPAAELDYARTLIANPLPSLEVEKVPGLFTPERRREVCGFHDLDATLIRALALIDVYVPEVNLLRPKLLEVRLPRSNLFREYHFYPEEILALEGKSLIVGFSNATKSKDWDVSVRLEFEASEKVLFSADGVRYGEKADQPDTIKALTTSGKPVDIDLSRPVL
jgi:hypothetical protein